MKTQVTTFGGGCFWCIEAIVQQLKGVTNVVSGYTGGTVPGTPTYREICSGKTGHAEVVQVTFDADIISLQDLITIFMTSHDPTTLNRQGADSGTQYRSVIYYHDAEQKQVIENVIQKVQEIFDDPIVTEVSEASIFFEADQDHQDFYKENSGAGYCRVVIDPKIAKLRNMYSHYLA